MAKRTANYDLRQVIDDLAQQLQVIAPLATSLRRTLGEVSEEAVAIEAAADRAVRIVRRLRPKEHK